MSSRTAKLLAAVLAVPLFAGLSAGQNQVDPRVNTQANNRVGSGGVNEPPRRDPQTGNLLVTGNVTGGREFRGAIDYSDPRAFRGATSGADIDRFIRGSAGARSVNTVGERPFFGESRAVPPPPGFERLPGVGGFVAPRTAPPGIPTMDARLDAMPAQGGLMPPVGSAIINPVFTGTFDAPDSVLRDPLASQMLRGLTATALDPLGASGIDPEALQRMQIEVEMLNPNNPLVNPVLPGIEAEPDTMIDVPGGFNNNAIRAVPMPGTSQAAAVEQSTQLAQLRASLVRFHPQGLGVNPVLAQRHVQPQPMEIPAAGEIRGGGQGPQVPTLPTDDPVAPGPVESSVPEMGAVQPGGLPGLVDPMAPGGLGGLQLPPTPAPRDAELLTIRSLAEGVQPQSVADVMLEAEKLMREGRFGDASRRFAVAAAAAPDNAMIRVGSAISDFGATFYTRAYNAFADVAAKEPAVLLARYDLEAMIGRDRLQFVAEDLLQHLQRNPDDAGAAFLLAFTYHNLSQPERAVEFLNRAQRLKPNELLFRQARQAWRLAEMVEPNK